MKRRPTRLEDADEQIRADFEAVKVITARVRDRDGRPQECLERGPLRVEVGAGMTLFHYWGVAYGFTRALRWVTEARGSDVVVWNELGVEISRGTHPPPA